MTFLAFHAIFLPLGQSYKYLLYNVGASGAVPLQAMKHVIN